MQPAPDALGIKSSTLKLFVTKENSQLAIYNVNLTANPVMRCGASPGLHLQKLDHYFLL
jgi:hypothetical protein